MKKILLFAIIALEVLSSCNRSLTKDEILATMSGIWTNKFNPSLELDLISNPPQMKSRSGEIFPMEIINIDVENLSVIFQEQAGLKLKGTLRLKKLDDDTYALAWKYDTGQYLMFSYVRKLDRYLERP